MNVTFYIYFIINSDVLTHAINQAQISLKTGILMLKIVLYSKLLRSLNKASEKHVVKT